MDATLVQEMRRRKTDSENASEEIDSMIKKGDNPQMIGVLLVLKTINDSQITSNESLVAVGITMGAINKKIEGHIDDETKMVATFKGGWSVLAKFLSILQVVLVGMVSLLYHDLTAVNDMLAKQETRMQLLELQTKQHAELKK